MEKQYTLFGILESSIDAAKGRLERLEFDSGEVKDLLEFAFDEAKKSVDYKDSLESVYTLIEDWLKEFFSEQEVYLGPEGNPAGKVRNIVKLEGIEVLRKEAQGIASAVYQFRSLNIGEASEDAKLKESIIVSVPEVAVPVKRQLRLVAV